MVYIHLTILVEIDYVYIYICIDVITNSFDTYIYTY